MAPKLPSGPRSPYCTDCNRRITNPESQRIGMGPVCAARAGLRAEGIDDRQVVRGARGSVDSGLRALARLVAGRRKIKQAVLVSYQDDGIGERRLWAHGFVLVLEGDWLEVVGDGFSSGYGGRGARGLAEAVAALGSVEFRCITPSRARADELFSGCLDPALVAAAALPLGIEVVSDVDWASYIPSETGGGDRLLVRVAPPRDVSTQLSLVEET